jgi:polyhydroxyalkanoate synthesis regulator phasin
MQKGKRNLVPYGVSSFTTNKNNNLRKALIPPCGVLVSVIAVMSAIILFSTIVRADQTEKLIQILIAKGIITSEEGESLAKEVKKEDAPEKEAKDTASSSDEWTKNIEVGYKKGAYIKTADDRFSLKLNVRTQGAFSYQWLEDETNTANFRVRRARILAGGNVFYPWMKYFTQVTLEGGSTALRDAYIEADYYDVVKPRIGQYKIPFDREFLTSAFNLQLIDRSIASNAFSLQRDIGTQLSGEFIEDRLNYSVGIFNGSGANRNNVDNAFMYVGRMVFTPFGSYPYSQAALDTPDTPKLAIGIAGAYLPGLEPEERKTLAGTLGDTDILPVESDVYQLTADLAFKYQNFSFEGGYHFRSIDPDEQTPFGKENAQGFYLQGGYFLIPKKFELAARYAFVDPDNPNQNDDNKQQEYTGGLNYYMYEHNLKLQADYSFFRNETELGDHDNHQVQAMMTLAF